MFLYILQVVLKQLDHALLESDIFNVIEFFNDKVSLNTLLLATQISPPLLV